MNDEDFKELEKLIGKLSLHIGYQIAIAQGPQDGYHLAAYNRNGDRITEVMSYDLKDTSEKLRKKIGHSLKES